MTKIAYLECPTGIAGDMCLGAIVDGGVPLEYIAERLSQLGIASEYRLRAETVHRNGQRATKVHVELQRDAAFHPIADTAEAAAGDRHTHSATEQSETSEVKVHHNHSHSHSHGHHSHTTVSSVAEHRHERSSIHDHNSQATIRHLPEIEQLILAAGLPSRAEAWSLAVFRQLAKAEGAVHGIPPEQVHFHEVGATDAIVDIVGTCLGLDWLGIEALYCSPLPVGGGTVWAAHGRLPVPAPAVLKLLALRQVPVYSNGIERELVTPTGAAIATTLATAFGAPPSMTLQQIGLGAGSIDLALPNVLRLWLGERGSEGAGERRSRGAGEQGCGGVGEWGSQETIAMLETQIDDLTPQAIGYVFEALFAVGALDVFTQAIAMKKSRPGVLLTVLCRPETAAACESVLFQETTTLGIRRSLQERSVLYREIQSVETALGSIRVKVAWAEASHQTLMNVQPEFEDCAAIARQQKLPWREVHRLALQAWYGQR